MKTHVSMSEIVDVLRRRKKYFLVPFLVICLISIIGAFVLPKRYESYTTILLQRDQTLNPLMDWTRSVMAVNDNQLASFNEILLSRTTIKSMLDSLRRSPDANSNEKWDDLIENTRKRIATELRGNDSFRISFADADPYACQKGTTVLCNLYIQTSLKSELQQAEETVKFLEQKVEELRKDFELKQSEYLNIRQRGLAVQPDEEGSLRPKLAKEQEGLTAVEQILEQQQWALSQIRLFQESLDDPTTISQIAALQPLGVTGYVDTLKALSIRYNQLLTRYTPRYPQVQAVRTELKDMLVKSAEALQAAIQNTKAQRASMGALRGQTLRGLSSSINISTVSTERGSEYLRVKENFDAAKQKLDQAKISKELSDRGASKYVILDPPQVPTTPTKPKKALVIGGGSVLGLVVGVVTMLMMEYYDPTIRRKQDIEIFHKPIIGYLP